jgi:hypothetical protein
MQTAGQGLDQLRLNIREGKHMSDIRLLKTSLGRISFSRALIGTLATGSMILLPVTAKAIDMHQVCNKNADGLETFIGICGECTAFGVFPGRFVFGFCFPCG